MLGAALLAVPVSGQDIVRIHQKDGQYVDFALKDRPVIYYEDYDLVLITDKTELSFPLATLAKFTFTDVETKIEAVEDDQQDPAFTLDDYAINITGAKAEVPVRVISSDGKPVVSFKTDAQGNAAFSMADLPAGMYIINSENLTFKVLKK